MPVSRTPTPVDAVDEQITLTRDANGVRIETITPALQFYHSYVAGVLARRAAQANQALLRACSNKQRSIQTVLDLTAGWGADALTLAWHGKTVVMLERNPVLYSVVAHSLACLAESTHGASIAARLALENVDALDYLRGPDAGRFDCIYLDPMFPQHKSGAKPTKEMQILQRLTDNHDIEACFEAALQQAGKRVVVKRPLKAPGLVVDKPDLVKREKTIRFDIYLTG